MSFQLEWLVEGRIVLCELKGKLTSRLVQVVAEETRDLIQDFPIGQVHFVIDLTQLDDLDITLADMPQEHIATPSSLNWVVIISQPEQKISSNIKFLVSVAAQKMQVRQRFFETRSAAFDFLYNMDDRLAEDLP